MSFVYGVLCGWQGRAGQYPPPRGEVDPSVRCLICGRQKGLSSKSTAGAGIMLGKVRTRDLF